MRRFLIAVATSLGMMAVPTFPASAETDDTQLCEGCDALLDLALSHPRREADRARDVWRHPAETLAFFRVKPGMTVVDYMPSSGWYTRVLVPYLGKDGSYIALNPASGRNERFSAMTAGLAASFPAKAAQWDLQGAPVAAFNTDGLPDAVNGTVDRVLIFREMHNLHRNGLLHDELNALHDLLKTDGMLGIVQHRAKAWAPADYVDGNKGYMRQQDVIGLVEAHGFDLVATSEINANAMDPADHEGGVWEMPPIMRSGNEALKDLGESDRMTLLFRKRP